MLSIAGLRNNAWMRQTRLKSDSIRWGEWPRACLTLVSSKMLRHTLWNYRAYFQNARIIGNITVPPPPRFKSFWDALRSHHGKMEAAKHHLMHAASSDGSPVMSSFGPNMSMAHDLLLAGEKQALLDYFQVCRKFWESRADQLDDWEMCYPLRHLPHRSRKSNWYRVRGN